MNDNQQLCICMLSCLNVDSKIQNHVLVSGSSASSPPATSAAVVTCTSSVCSVCLNLVGSSGAVPDHASK